MNDKSIPSSYQVTNAPDGDQANQGHQLQHQGSDLNQINPPPLFLQWLDQQPSYDAVNILRSLPDSLSNGPAVLSSNHREILTNLLARALIESQNASGDDACQHIECIMRICGILRINPLNLPVTVPHQPNNNNVVDMQELMPAESPPSTPADVAINTSTASLTPWTVPLPPPAATSPPLELSRLISPAVVAVVEEAQRTFLDDPNYSDAEKDSMCIDLLNRAYQEMVNQQQQVEERAEQVAPQPQLEPVDPPVAADDEEAMAAEGLLALERSIEDDEPVVIPLLSPIEEEEELQQEQVVVGNVAEDVAMADALVLPEEEEAEDELPPTQEIQQADIIEDVEMMLDSQEALFPPTAAVAEPVRLELLEDDSDEEDLDATAGDEVVEMLVDHLVEEEEGNNNNGASAAGPVEQQEPPVYILDIDLPPMLVEDGSVLQRHPTRGCLYGVFRLGIEDELTHVVYTLTPAECRRNARFRISRDWWNILLGGRAPVETSGSVNYEMWVYGNNYTSRCSMIEAEFDFTGRGVRAMFTDMGVRAGDALYIRVEVGDDGVPVLHIEIIRAADHSLPLPKKGKK